MSSQFAELQTLFDEVSHQLYTECKRIEGVQETVNACVKQSKELEAIHHKLEESHQVLTQIRDTRGERIRTEHSKLGGLGREREIWERGGGVQCRSCGRCCTAASPCEGRVVQSAHRRGAVTSKTSQRNSSKPDLGNTGQQVNGAGLGDLANTRVRE